MQRRQARRNSKKNEDNVRKQCCGYGIRDLISYFRELRNNFFGLKILKFFGLKYLNFLMRISGFGIFLNVDTGWKKRIRDNAGFAKTVKKTTC